MTVGRYLLTSRGSVRFETRRDFDALGEILKRTELGYKGPDVLAVEPVVNVNDEIECEHSWRKDPEDREALGSWTQECDRPADVRIVRNRGYQHTERFEPDAPTGIYSDTFCLSCFREAMHEWVDTQADRVADAVEEKRE